MGGHPFPGIACTSCAKPLDLTVDLYADEYGKAIHEDCYVKQITNSPIQPPARMMAN